MNWMLQTAYRPNVYLKVTMVVCVIFLWERLGCDQRISLLLYWWINPNPLQAFHWHPAECHKMQQQESAQTAHCNKIHQLEQWFFCSLLKATICNNKQVCKATQGNKIYQLEQWFFCSLLKATICNNKQVCKATQGNKIYQLKQWFFCSLLRSTRCNNFLLLFHLVALSMVRVNRL